MGGLEGRAGWTGGLSPLCPSSRMATNSSPSRNRWSIKLDVNFFTTYPVGMKVALGCQPLPPTTHTWAKIYPSWPKSSVNFFTFRRSSALTVGRVVASERSMSDCSDTWETVKGGTRRSLQTFLPPSHPLELEVA